MAYSKQTWIDGTSIANAERLNHIEDGIYENSKNNVYSTNEVDTGKVWIDGSHIYRKIVEIDALPNSTTAQYTHNITNIDTTISCYGVVSKEDNSVMFTMPMNGIVLWFDRTYISIVTSSNRSSYNGKVILEYTKTTD